MNQDDTSDEAQGGKGGHDTPDEANGPTGGRVDALRRWWSMTLLARKLRPLWTPKRHDEPHVKLDDPSIRASDVKAAAAGAALAHVLSRPDSIRQRAQSAATISSAVVAALVIAGLSQLASGKASFHWPTDIALGIALALWGVGVWGYVYAVAFIDKGQDPPAGYQELVNSYEAYADDVRAKTRFAATCSGLALGATVVAMLLEIIIELQPSSPDQRMQLVLTKAGAADVTAMCSWGPWGPPPSDSVRVEGLVAATDQALVRIKNVKLLTTTKRPAGGKALPPCVHDGVDVRVPRSAILVARTTDP